MKTQTLAAFALLASPLLLRAQVTESYTSSNPPVAVPDGGAPVSTITDTLTISGSAITTLTDVNVLLDIRDTWNGDLKVTLTHNGHTAVLLNRTGKDDTVTGNPASGNDSVDGSSEIDSGTTPHTSYGYSDNGFGRNFSANTASSTPFRLDDQATLAGGQTATGDVHIYRRLIQNNNSRTLDGTLSGDPFVLIGNSIPLTGNWQPDGRNVAGDAVVEATGRTALLAVFNGDSPNGAWTVTYEDWSAGDPATGNPFTVELTGTPVPEPSTYAAVFGLFSFAGIVAMRRAKKGMAVLG